MSSTVKKGKIKVGKTELDLNAVLKSDKLASYEGKKIVLGFRPEGTELGTQADSYVLEADVELTELLGDNTNVYVDIDDVKTILKVDPHDTPKMDTKIQFSIPYKNVYLFDGETEFVIEDGRKQTINK